MNTRTRLLALICALVGVLLLGALAAVSWSRARAAGWAVPRAVVPRMTEHQYERWARAVFLEEHPGEKPLNWAIARTVAEFHETHPMGKFIRHENDCSDFVGCVVDHALGAGARFERGSEDHALCGPGGAVRRRLFRTRRLPDVDAVQPGDVVGVRHSPWYPPKEETIGHVGIIGPDGFVYDFVKLRSWRTARYGRVKFEWFTRHSEPEQVYVSRLRPEYRYRLREVPQSDLGHPTSH